MVCGHLYVVCVCWANACTCIMEMAVLVSTYMLGGLSVHVILYTVGSM